MSRRPRFSVTIPVHNGAAFLPFTLKSVLAQDPGPDQMQIVVVDDCSTDHPAGVITACGAEHRVEYIRSDVPLGPARAFNRCVEAASGDLVHLLHADDLVVPGFYRRVDEVFSADLGLSLFVCRAYEIDARGRRTTVLSIPPLVRSRRIEHFYHLLVPVNWVRTPGVVVPRSAYAALGVYDERLNHTQDWNMWLRLATHGATWYEDEPLADYRVHNASDTTFKLKNGRYLAEFYLAVKYWLDGAPGVDRDRYLAPMAAHVRKLAMEDLWRTHLQAERVALIRQIFAEHLSELAADIDADIVRAQREQRGSLAQRLLGAA